MNLLRALATVSSLTLVSRILGYLRDFIIARAFGAGLATDAFFVAFRIPNLLRRLFAEGAFSQAFVPVLAEYKNRTSPEETRRVVDGVGTLLFLALVVVAALGMALAPIVVYISAPGFAADAGKFGLTVTMLRITFPYIAFISLVAFSAGILNTWNRFALPAITPTMLNIAFIVAAHQHDLRVLSRLRQRVLALLRRPADGIPGGRARRRAGVHSPAEPVEVPCRRQARGIWRAARLGPAPCFPPCRAERRRPRRAGIAACGDAVSLRPLHRRGRVDDAAGAGRV